MDRREMFKMLGLAGAGVGASSVTKPAMAAQSTSGSPTQSASTPTTANPVIGVDNWPFKETHMPYRERKAKIKWPNNARLAVRVYVVQEWSSAPRNVGSPLYYGPDLYAISRDSQYTFTTGIYRTMDLIEKYGIKISAFPNAAVVKAYPDLIKEIHRAGHEITARSWDQGVAPPLIRPDQMETELKRATDTIAQVIGERPVGWISPGAKPTPQSIEMLANMDYLWVGDLDGDDIPYGVHFGNKTIVSIPHRQDTTNDFAIYNRVFGSTLISSKSAADAHEFFRETFDGYYQTATEEAPTMMMYGIHPSWSAWPDRIHAHDKNLRYMKGFKDVWFCRHRDLAQHWKQNYL